MVSDSVKELVNEIINKKNLKEISGIKYERGSDLRDGFISKTVAVEIITEKGKFCLFIKCPSDIKSDVMPMEELYKNEIRFYNEIRTEFLRFSKEKCIENALSFIPMYYGSFKNILATENLREKDFVLCDRTKSMNDAHIKLVLKAFAKFHGTCYAFKDQERKKYDILLKNVFDVLSYDATIIGMKSLVQNTIKDFVSYLDPVEEKYFLEKCIGLADKLIPSITSAKKTSNKYWILAHSDCHCKNMMFTYKDENKENPTDFMLVDWQCIRAASPVFDISDFFYPVASEEALSNLTYYLKFYHKELSKTIRLLGSDPDVLYPYEVLEKEWKQCCKYGFTKAFVIIRELTNGGKNFNIETFDFETATNSDQSNETLSKDEEEYKNKMKILIEHMVKNDFL